MTRTRFGIFVAVLGMALTVFASAADARMGRGGSIGSRGVRTWGAPPVTRTAPQPAAPIERSMTPAQRNTTAAQRTPSAGVAARPGLFGSGFAGGLFGGLLGAGLFGMLFGHGFFGGIGGLGSIFGLLLQLALVYFLVRWAMNAWQRRSRPAYAGAGEGPAGPRGYEFTPAGDRGASRAQRTAPVNLSAADQDAFEEALTAIQDAYGREDLTELRRRMTPEMVSFVAEELADNARRGVVNRLSDVRLLQGDLSEAWREGWTEYATVAMRYRIRDEVFDRSSGAKLEEGPGEVTEVWTFRREPQGAWLLSAIQQT